jgi:hypothetical protein
MEEERRGLGVGLGLLVVLAGLVAVLSSGGGSPDMSPENVVVASAPGIPAPARPPVSPSGAPAGGTAAVEECAVLTARDGAAVTQAPDGRLSGCFRVGFLPAGPYTLHLEQGVRGRQAPPAGGRVRLTPAAGPPGTTVQISGFFPGARAGGQTPSEVVTVCWGGCESGFSEYQPVRWSPDGHFTTRFEVPAIPWLAVDGPQPLRSGEYRIGLCIPSCGGGSDDAEAVFRLQTGEPKLCVEGRPCARLELTPADAPPGAIVRFEGWAPLLPRPYRYALHVAEGHTDDDDDEIVRSPGRRGAAVRLAPTRFTALPGRRWAELPHATPALQVTSGPSLAAVPDDPRLLAHCVPDGIRISRDSGAHWEVVKTRTVPTATEGTGHRIAYPDPALCTAPVPDPRHPRSVFAKFTVVPEGSEPPPWYDWGMFTPDGGRTWRRVPVPPGASMEHFEGFALSGGSVLARFRHRQEPSQWRGNAPALDWEPGMLVMETSDGGRTWSPGRDACPPRGPCVSWGPTAEYNCAKGRSFRLVRTSAEGGRTWSSRDWPGWIATCDAASLVSLSDGDVLLLAPDNLAELFPVRLSRDGGSTWQPIALPALPDTSSSPTPDFPNLTMLGDGRLLAVAYPFGPQLLYPGAATWCAVKGEPLGPALEAGWKQYESIGGRLWWMDYRAREVRSVPHGDLRCQ